MKTKTRKVEVFIAEDGKEFLTAKDCEQYEKEELARWKEIRFFRVIHSPDLTEGRGWGASTYLAVEAGYSAQHYVELFCEQTFGSRVAFVQGCSPMTSWTIYDVTLKQFIEKLPGTLGDYNRQVDQIFLSNGKPLKDLPDPQKLPKEK